MTTDRLPETPYDLTAGWITDQLHGRFPAVEITEVSILQRREVTNSHSKLALTSAGNNGVPSTVFAKMPPESGRRSAILGTGMGEREVHFYSHLAPRLTMRVPLVYVALVDPDDGSFVLLLEDLDSTGCRISDGTWSISPDGAAVALEDLAQLHLRYADVAIRQAEAGWVEPSRPGSNHVHTTLRSGLDNHRDRLSGPFAQLAELYLDHASVLHAIWQDGPQTVVHGDPHIGNLFVDGGRTGFLDWGMISVTTPLRDVSYFINLALDIEDRRTHERDLLRHYLSIWNANNDWHITFDDAWTAHRRHAAYCVPACCQIVTFPPDATEARRVFADAFLAKSEAAISDLEALPAILAAADLGSSG